jgi:hypothetical protein
MNAFLSCGMGLPFLQTHWQAVPLRSEEAPRRPTRAIIENAYCKLGAGKLGSGRGWAVIRSGDGSPTYIFTLPTG